MSRKTDPPKDNMADAFSKAWTTVYTVISTAGFASVGALVAEKWMLALMVACTGTAIAIILACGTYLCLVLQRRPRRSPRGRVS